MSFDFAKAIVVTQETVTKQFWDVDGRMSKDRFLHFAVIPLVILILLGVLTSIVSIFSIVSMVFSLAIAAPFIGASIRRVHDQGKVWWYSLIPFYNLYLCFFVDGDAGTNEFGEPPVDSATTAAD